MIYDVSYAPQGDRFYDLANFSRLNEFPDEEDVLLLKIYFGTFDDKQMVRLQLMKTVAELHEVCLMCFATCHLPHLGVHCLQGQFVTVGRVVPK